VTHGFGSAKPGQRTPEYVTYLSARKRCNCPTDKAYPNYGGRGVRFLYTSFEQFFADLGRRPPGRTASGKMALYSLDRFPNNDGNYEPGNCRWATTSEQAKNRRPQKRIVAEQRAEIIRLQQRITELENRYKDCSHDP
jgi:hypothetical protein